MTLPNYLFSSESVTEGHPDKVADKTSDAILDALLAKDRKSRVACETMVKSGMMVLAGEITSRHIESLDVPKLARRVVKDIGYTDPDMGFDGTNFTVIMNLSRQSEDISVGVTKGTGEDKEQGAGDQGMMFGFACDETPELMPMPIMYAHRLTQKLAQKRKNKTLPYLRPDGKSQVTVLYENGKPVRVTDVVIAAQHAPGIKKKQLVEGIIEEVIYPSIPKKYRTPDPRYLINRTGVFEKGGPMADCGLTGRKIIADTYGGMGRHGGGAFSGKDPSKVDRSAAYMARYVAKNVVAAKLATRCEVQLAYCIGEAEPVSVMVETFGTGKIPDNHIALLIRKHFNMRPEAITKHLDLMRPIYEKTAAYGHFGRKDKDFTWENTDKAKALAENATKKHKR